MKHLFASACVLILSLPQPAWAQTQDTPKCQELIALFLELAERSGETVTPQAARAEVMAENPTDQECAAMIELFAQYGQE
ncbi:MAG: hypothetical protein AAFP87_00300 [Pseudomonadota bacterium]